MDVNGPSVLSSTQAVGDPYYYRWMVCSLVVCLFIHHVISPTLFRRFNKSYREFSREKRMEWDSRLVSSIHATVVSTLCAITLLQDRTLWLEPLTHRPVTGLVALSISVGYFLCDMISMPFYWKGSQLLIFILHHCAAVVAFQQVVHYQICAFFGVYRLTTEMSTPFINQRWFYRTIGYKPDRKRVCSVTLLFAIFFAVTRNFMIVPFWYIAYQAFTSSAYPPVKEAIPWLDVAFATPPLVLDCLNIYWARKTYRIGWRAAKSLWCADWRTDIQLAHARLKRKLRRIRRRAESESIDGAPVQSVDESCSTKESLNEPIQEYYSSSNYSSETEYEAVDSDDNVDDRPVTEKDISYFTNLPDSDEQQVTHRAH